MTRMVGGSKPLAYVIISFITYQITKSDAFKIQPSDMTD